MTFLSTCGTGQDWLGGAWGWAVVESEQGTRVSEKPKRASITKVFTVMQENRQAAWGFERGVKGVRQKGRLLSPFSLEWNFILVHAVLGIYPFLSLVSATSDTHTECVCAHRQVQSWYHSSYNSVSDPGGYDSCRLLPEARTCEFSLGKGLQFLQHLLPLFFSLSRLSPCPPLFPALFPWAAEHIQVCAHTRHTHTRPLVVANTRNRHQQRVWLWAVFRKFTPSPCTKHSIATSPPVTPLLEIMAFGKLLIQGLVPSAVLQSCNNKHTQELSSPLKTGRAWWDRVISPFQLQAVRKLGCQVPDFLPRCPPFSPAFQLKLCVQHHSSNPGALVPCCHGVTGPKKPQLSTSRAFTVPLAAMMTEIVISAMLHQWKVKDAEMLFFPSGLPKRENNHLNRTVFPWILQSGF